jgi:hypothetical protein
MGRHNVALQLAQFVGVMNRFGTALVLRPFDHFQNWPLSSHRE